MPYLRLPHALAAVCLPVPSCACRTRQAISQKSGTTKFAGLLTGPGGMTIAGRKAGRFRDADGSAKSAIIGQIIRVVRRAGLDYEGWRYISGPARAAGPASRREGGGPVAVLRAPLGPWNWWLVESNGRVELVFPPTEALRKLQLAQALAEGATAKGNRDEAEDRFERSIPFDPPGTSEAAALS